MPHSQQSTYAVPCSAEVKHAPGENHQTDFADALRQHRLDMQRYRALNAKLPFNTQATCPGCWQPVPAQFANNDNGQLVLHFDCPDCGPTAQVHHDTVWSTNQSDRPGSAEETYSGHVIQPNARALPRALQTLCPECGAVVIGRYFVKDSAVMIEKNCPAHGHFHDIINRDVRMFLKGSYWSFEEQPGLLNPANPGTTACPSDCGFCGRHQSCSCLANIDLTNRCNLNCPICFANANVAGYVYEPSFEQIRDMLQNLRNIKPTPATAVQFSGGEPTIHPRFHDILRCAKELGFSNIQIATNGLKMANYEFAEKTRQAGLHTLYLQFDGVDPEIYLRTRGRDIWDKKLAAIENCRRLDLKVCLVPTIIKTINDDQVSKIFQFAVQNIDVVSAISYQPVCFTGRIDTEQRLRQRYTLGDLAHDLAQASGAVIERDFYPLSIVMPLSQMLESVTGNPKIKPSCHTDCAFGTYFLVDDHQQVHPFPKVLDVEALFSGMNKLAKKFAPRAGKISFLDKIRLLNMFKNAFHPDQMPPGLTIKRFINALQGLVDKNQGRGTAGQTNYRTLMAAGMHFQDRYNYDIERVKRCVIPYSTPLGMIPFCAYNSGPMYRSLVEKLYAH
ncbi:MAG: radical SAM protein [Sedimentisphaerales bacterium]|nr:radical SAM protein [Sedimentisphaerales bacterium]